MRKRRPAYKVVCDTGENLHNQTHYLWTYEDSDRAGNIEKHSSVKNSRTFTPIMVKKKAGEAKVSAKAAKKAKAARKVERKEKKSGKGKSKDEADAGEDLESILEQMRQEWEAAHSVTEELVQGPPSRRANATLTACPTGNHLWFIGGEFFSEDGKAYFYNDVFRYSPEKDEWRKFVSPTCPGPRSAHAVATTAAGGGKLFLFGGEFSSQNQTTFYHYRDFWCFDIATHSWDRIDIRVRPTARSGHRMAVWKHYIVLFGGFYDPGITTRYLNDLWLFDTQEYKWHLVDFRPNQSRPCPRSGFSFLSTSEGVILHGGYCKEYVKGKRPIGIMLEDTWLLQLSLPDASSSGSNSNSAEPSSSKKKLDLVIKWERRKRPSTAYIPALRSGCTMTAWQVKEMGVMFGGVTDEDTNEETLESLFWNDLNAYQWSGKGRWVSLTLRKPKKKPGKQKSPAMIQHGNESDDELEDLKTPIKATPRAPSTVTTKRLIGGNVDPDDPMLTIPLPRYNAMLAVLKNSLYIYGGIFERGSREYTLDDFYTIQLDKMDRFVCLKESGVIIEEGDDESDDEETENGDEDDEDEEDDDDDYYSDDEGTVVGSVATKDELDELLFKPILGDDLESATVIEEIESEDESNTTITMASTEKVVDLRSQATTFMGVLKDTSRSSEDMLSTPLPGETLAMFYSRSRDYWSQKALLSIGSGLSDVRGKQLRTVGFNLAEERYQEYKPILNEVERMLAEAGLDDEEIRRSAAGGGVDKGKNRNRR